MITSRVLLEINSRYIYEFIQNGYLSSITNCVLMMLMYEQTNAINLTGDTSK
jgi:hypothetical protein